MMHPVRIRHSRTLIHRQPENFLFYNVFTRENATYFLRKSSSPFSLQELRPLTPLKEKNRFTSLTVIGMTKIMCNNKAFHGQHRIEKSYNVGDIVWLQLNKERLHGPSKKIKDLQYDPFEVLEKVGDNAYILNLPPYMHIYSIVNVENLKLYEPSMLDQ
jgi:hypothetical protein